MTTPPQMHWRPMPVAERRRAAILLSETFRTTWGRLPTEAERRRIEQDLGDLADGLGGRAELLCDGPRTVAHYAVRTGTAGVPAVLLDLYVRPDLRRQGLGLATLRRARRAAGGPLAVTVGLANDAGRRLFEGAGADCIDEAGGVLTLMLPDAA